MTGFKFDRYAAKLRTFLDRDRNYGFDRALYIERQRGGGGWRGSSPGIDYGIPPHPVRWIKARRSGCVLVVIKNPGSSYWIGRGRTRYAPTRYALCTVQATGSGWRTVRKWADCEPGTEWRGALQWLVDFGCGLLSGSGHGTLDVSQDAPDDDKSEERVAEKNIPEWQPNAGDRIADQWSR